MKKILTIIQVIVAIIAFPFIVGILALVFDWDYEWAFWGCTMLVVFWLLFERAEKKEKQRKIEEQINEYQQLWDDMISRLQKMQPIDDIALDYQQSEDIPPIRTIQVIANVIRSFAKSESDEEKKLADILVSAQTIDSHVDPVNQIAHFNFSDSVYFMDDTASLMEQEDSEIGRSGTIILHKGFLYFFAKSASLYDIPNAEKLLDKVGDFHPVLGIALSGYKLGKGLSEKLSDCFDQSTCKKLRDRYENDKSFVIPLVNIINIDICTSSHFFSKKSILHITCTQANKTHHHYFKTSLEDQEAWTPGWIDRIELACIAEGRLLPSLANS